MDGFKVSILQVTFIIIYTKIVNSVHDLMIFILDVRLFYNYKRKGILIIYLFMFL